MNWLRRPLARLRSLFRKEEMERELEKELQSHLEMHVEDSLRAGMTAEEARRDALIKLGGMEQTKERYREQRGYPLLESVLQDVRYGLRVFRKNPAFTSVAVMTLALAIAASTIVSSVGYGVLLNALPYKNFNRSVVFRIENLANVGGWKGRDFFSAGEFRAFREENHVFEEMIAFVGARLLYDDGKSKRYLPFGEEVSPNTFDYLGVSPLLGRTFSKEDGMPGAPAVFVMSYRLWHSEFGGDPKMLGKTFILTGTPTVLVGIMPPRFNAFNSSFWVRVNEREAHGQLMGRLKPGVSLKAAQEDLDEIAHRLQKQNPDSQRDDSSIVFPGKFAIRAQSQLDSLIGNFKNTIYGLSAAVLVLLLISCSNVANLLFARASVREREIGLRAAVGASRGRLVRQLLSESFLLAASAAVVGYALAYLGLKVVVSLIPSGTLPEETVIRMDGHVLLFSLAVTILTTVLCGLAPALHIVRGDLHCGLSATSKGTGGSFRYEKVRAGLVVGEVALSIVLLVCAGLLMRSFLVLTRVNLGFDPKNVLFFRLSFPSVYNTDVPGNREKRNTMIRQLLERMAALPGVVHVAESVQEPPLKYDWSDTIIPGRPHAERWETRFESCSEGYFQTLGIPLLRGRFFSKEDVSSARFVMVVNQAFAKQYFPNEDPIGQKIKLEVLDRAFLDAPHDTYFDVVGVAGDYKTRDFESSSWQTFPEVYFPYSVQGFSWRTFMARTAVDPSSLLNAMRQEVKNVDPTLQVAVAGTLEGTLQEYYRGPQFELVTLAAFAVTGLLLAMIGIFSVMAYTVSQQTHDIGIRLALGAQQRSIQVSVLLNGLRLVLAGVAIGVPVSLATTRFLTSEISGVSATDPWTFGVVVVFVMSVGLIACWLPALRATKVDPMVALRYE